MLNLTREQVHAVIKRQRYLEDVADIEYDAQRHGWTIEHWWHVNLWVYLGFEDK